MLPEEVAVVAMAVAAKVAVTAVAAKVVAMAVAAKAAAMAVVRPTNQLKTDLLELKVGKIVVMAVHHKMQAALIKDVVEEEEVLRLKGEMILPKTMVAQNLKDFFANAQHPQVAGQYFLK